MNMHIRKERKRRRSAKKIVQTAILLLLTLTLAITGLPFVPGPAGQATKAYADTSMRIEPNRINPAKGETARVLFSFNDADAGDTSHRTVISTCRVNPQGGFPILEDTLTDQDYAVYDENGNIKENEFVWDGTIGGQPAADGRYLLCVNPQGFHDGGTFYGYMASVDVLRTEQPAAPKSLKLERSASGGAVVRGIAEPGAAVTVQIWNEDGEERTAAADLAVSSTGQWSAPVELADGRIARITAYASKGGQRSVYSGMLRALRYAVPASITWDNAAAYYYKSDTAETLAKQAVQLAADNGFTGIAASGATASAIPAGTALLVMEPLVSGSLNPADAPFFTADAVADRRLGARPSGVEGPVDPATGSFVFRLSQFTLAGLPPLSLGLSYDSRDGYEGAMGTGWRHSFDWRLEEGENGKQLLSMPDGSVYEYVPLANGGYMPPRGMMLELSRGTSARAAAASGDGYQLDFPDGSRYWFNRDGLPEQFADANGNAIAFTYNGKLLTGITSGGAALNLAYEGDRLVSVQDQTGRAASYRYDAAGQLAAVELADGAVYGFGYDGNGRVNRVIKPESVQSAGIEYDEEGRVTAYTDEWGAVTHAAYRKVVGDDGGQGGGGSTGDTSIDPANSRDIPESDKVLLSGVMGNERNAPPFLQVEGLREVIAPYISGQKNAIEQHIGNYEAQAVSGGSSVSSIQQAIATASSRGTAVVKAGGLNLEESVVFGSPSQPVVLIVDGINTNQPLQIEIYGTLIVKGSLNANTKLSVAAHSLSRNGNTVPGNLWVTGPVHLNNDSTLAIDSQLYAGTLTYNNGLLDVSAGRILVDGNLNINTRVDMTVGEELAVGEIVSNNETAQLTIEDGDLFVRDQVSVNNHLSVSAGGLFAVGGSFTPNQRPLVATGIGNGHTLLKYKTAASAALVQTETAVGKSQAAALAAFTDSNAADSASVTEQQTITTLTDALGQAREYEFDYRYNLTALRDAANSSWSYAYDGNDSPARFVDAEGHEVRYVYDQKGQLQQSTDALGYTDTRITGSRGKPVRLQDPSGAEQTRVYNGSGNLVQATDPLGHISTYEYDARGVLVRSVNPEGEADGFAADPASGQLLSKTDALNAETLYQRDALNRLASVSDGLGIIRSYRYDGRDRTVESSNAAGDSSLREYDKQGRLISSTDTAGAVTAIAYRDDPGAEVVQTRTVTDSEGHETVERYDRLGRLVSKTDARGGITSYQYNSRNQVEAVTDPDGYITRYAYDRNGQMVNVTDPQGGETRYSYDERNLLVQVQDAGGGTVSYEYDGRGLRVQETDALNRHTRYVYNAAGLLTAKLDPLNQTTAYEYDKTGRQVKTILPNGAATITRYDERGQVIGSEDPNHGVTLMERDGRGRVTVYQDEEENRWAYEYDALDRVAAMTDPNGHRTGFTYDAAGRIRQVTDALQNKTAYTYDGLGRLTEVLDAKNGRTAYAYDPLGNLAEKQDANGNVTRYGYNGRNLVENRTNPLGEEMSWSYDANGNVLHQTAADGTLTRFQYDPLNRLTARTEEDGEAVSYTYDEVGLRTSMTDGSGTTLYAYDALNRLSKVETQGQEIRYEWTPNGKKARILYPDLRAVNYQYDAKDQLIKVEEAAGDTRRSTLYSYDKRGAVTTRTTPDGTVGRYAYDAAGQTKSISYTGSQGVLLEQLVYEYDPSGNRTKVTRTMSGSDEDASGGEPRTIVTQYTYDALQQLERAETLNGSTASYAYDAAGNRISRTVADGTESLTENYAYNAANRLTRWERGTDYKDYAYDLRGNLLTVNGVDSRAAAGQGKTAANAVPGADGLAVTGEVYGAGAGSQVTGSVYGSGAGLGLANPFALTGDQVLDQYSWTSSNRLKGVTDVAGNRTDYGYDGDGNRIYMGVNTADGTAADAYPSDHPAGSRTGWEAQYKKAVQEFHYTLDVSEPLPQVLQVAGADAAKWKETYVYGLGGEQLAMSYLPANDPDNSWEPAAGASGSAAGAEKTLYTLQDALGSTLALTGAGGEIAARHQYDEFGVPQAAEKFDMNWPGPDNLNGYTGLGYDYSSGLTYARARYYQPETGRFISEDTYQGDIKSPLSLNLYTYVGNNPLKYTDPSGHDAGVGAEFNQQQEIELNVELEFLYDGKVLIGVGNNRGTLGVKYELPAPKISTTFNKDEETTRIGFYNPGPEQLANGTLEVSMLSVYKKDSTTANSIGGTVGLSLLDMSVKNNYINIGSTIGSAEVSLSGKINKQGVEGSVGATASVVTSKTGITIKIMGIKVGLTGTGSLLTVGLKGSGKLSPETGFKTSAFVGAGLVGAGLTIDISWD